MHITRTLLNNRNGCQFNNFRSNLINLMFLPTTPGLKRLFVEMKVSFNVYRFLRWRNVKGMFASSFYIKDLNKKF